jgi:pimeloyl-ACP methyl ester carboxylesterase
MHSESVLRMGPGAGIVGILSTPLDRPAEAGLVILNAGLLYRVGPGRLHVRLGRAAAMRGYAALRIDLPGIGDSPGRNPGTRDVSAAIDELILRTGVRKVMLFGICAGGAAAYKTAIEDERVGGVLMVDTYYYPTFTTKVRYWGHRLRKSGPGSLIRAALARLRHSPDQSIEAADAFDMAPPPPDVYADQVRQITARGAFVDHVMSGEEPRGYNYAGQYANRFRKYRLGPLTSAEYYPEADHLFTRLQHQKRLIGIVLDRLDRLGQHSAASRTDPGQ